ncbi:unnamed protein product [Penicillium salamii]|nr:unnamed protein product [Penicillium salamii]
MDQHGNDQNTHSDEGSQNKTSDRRSTDNLYADISEETKLLREVKDICDELNMLKNLAEDQDDVWTQVWKGDNRPDATTYDTPTEVKAEIEEMVKEAEFVQKAIEPLLDLKQKRANIVEAEFTRQQSHDTAVQSDTIMVFTVVTILFVSSGHLSFILKISTDVPKAPCFILNQLARTQYIGFPSCRRRCQVRRPVDLPGNFWRFCSCVWSLLDHCFQRKQAQGVPWLEKAPYECGIHHLSAHLTIRLLK